MKILFLANNHLSPISGGIERTTFNLISELAKDITYELYAVFITIPVKIKDVKCIEDTIMNGKQINDYIERLGIDIVVFPAGAWYTNLLKSYNRNTKCKIISCLHSPPKVGEDYIIKNLRLEWKEKDILSRAKFFFKFLMTYCKQPLTVYQARRQYKLGYNNSDLYVLLSESYFDTFRTYARIDDISKLRAVGNALSFDSSEVTADLNQKKNEVLVVGRFDEISKRISYAIKAWKIVDPRNWHFNIVGFGKDEGIYRRMVANYKLKNISFEGQQNPISYYTKAKIFLMTSSFEGWPMTLLESLQTGCVPIVMDTFGSLHDIIEHNHNGIIIKDNDIIAMANAIQSLMDNQDEWIRISKNGIKSSSAFTIEKITNKWKNLFQTVMAQNE